MNDLIEALAAATGPSRELDERMATEMFGVKPRLVQDQGKSVCNTY